jgi:homocysteine S-methyltransferase
MSTRFPSPQGGVLYLTEGGQETELMYKHEFDLPEFAMYPLLDDARAVAALHAMYRSYLDTAASNGFVPLMGGLDYRASPGWARRLGLDAAALAEMQRRSIDFLREVAAPYEGEFPGAMFVGIVGPRGDAYEADHAITEDEAAEYHAVQVAALASCGVDLVEAMTFNNIAEAVGVARAAAAHGLPASISFTLDSTSRLHSGPSLREAIEAVDALAGPDAPAFYGINCSHPSEFLPALEPGPWFERVRCLRPNASTMDKVSLCTIGHLEAGDPPALGDLMGDIARRYPHIDIWGGCCGTWDTHLDEIARRVRAARAMTL